MTEFMTDLSVKKLTEIIMQVAEEKGFGVKPEDINTWEKIALIHTEISEAAEAYRRKNMSGRDGFAEELADAVSRILHLAAIYQIDLEAEIIKKFEANKKREWTWKKLNETHT